MIRKSKQPCFDLSSAQDEGALTDLLSLFLSSGVSMSEYWGMGVMGTMERRFLTCEDSDETEPRGLFFQTTAMDFISKVSSATHRVGYILK